MSSGTKCISRDNSAAFYISVACHFCYGLLASAHAIEQVIAMDNHQGDGDGENSQLNAGKRSPEHIAPITSNPPPTQQDHDTGSVHEALQFVNQDLHRINRELEEVDNAIARIRQEQQSRGNDRMMGSRGELSSPAGISSPGQERHHRLSLQSSLQAAAAGSDGQQARASNRHTSSSRSDYGSDSTLRKRGRPKGSSSSYRRSAEPKPWTNKEHDLFLEGVQRYGRGRWTEIAKNVLKSRTAAQIASHAQKHFARDSAKQDPSRGRKRAKENKDNESEPEEKEEEEEKDNDDDEDAEEGQGMCEQGI